MIFRLTQKMGKKIGISPSTCLPPDRNPFADWSAHLFTAQRVQYIIITNNPSLYSMVMYGRGITDDNRFLQGALNYMREIMTNDGNEFIYKRLIAPHTGRIFFSKIGDRRILGSINELVFQAKFYLIERELLPFDVSFLLNETPMSYLGYSDPRRAFKSLKIEQLGESNNNIECDKK